jgi:uncharacterized cofD-like protein
VRKGRHAGSSPSRSSALAVGPVRSRVDAPDNVQRVKPNNSIVALGGGRGLDSVLSALRGTDIGLTVIVSIADDGERGGDRQQRLTGAGVDELRRSLEALSGEGALLRAIRRPLTVEQLGRHRLGNLALASAAAAFGDYSRASIWLGEQLGIDGAVLPATIEPTRHETEVVDRGSMFKPARGRRRRVRKLRFAGEPPRSPDAAIAAIEEAAWVLLAPGALYRSVLPTAAVPDLRAALMRTSARVVWIANLEPDPLDASNLTAIEHLLVLRMHGVRVDAVLHDESATLKFDPAELAGNGAESMSRALCSRTDPALHEPEQLRMALSPMLSLRPASAVGS